jgi:type II secretion system protein H
MQKTGRGVGMQILQPLNYLHSFLSNLLTFQKNGYFKNAINFNIIKNCRFLALNLPFQIKGNLHISYFLGFTITEMLVVLAIIGILIGVAGPSLLRWRDSFEVKNSVREIQMTLQLARMKAITQGVEYRVVVDLERETFQLERGDQAEGSTHWQSEGKLFTLPAGVDIASVNSYTTGKRNKQFNPNGTCSSGSIKLQNKWGEKYTITLTPATGYIKAVSGW